MRILIFSGFLTLFIASSIDAIDFNPDDQITLFKAETFNANIASSDTAYVVEFFNPQCGFCISFAPIFAQFSRNIKGWSSVVKVGAVTSPDPAFPKSHGVNSFPTIKLYLPWLKGYAISFKGDTVDQLNGALLDTMRNASLEGRGLETWPKLNYVIDIDEMKLQVLEQPRKMHLLVVEDEEAQKRHLGELVIMDNSAAIEKVNIMRSHIDIASQYHMNTTGLYLFMDQQFVRMPGVFNRNGLNNLVSNLISINTNDTFNIPDILYGNATVNLTVTDETYVYRPAHGLHASDILAGLRHTLWFEVRMAKNITGPSMATLKAFLSLLSKYLPVDEHVSNFLNLLLDGLKDLTTISSADWLLLLENTQTDLAYIPANVTYKGCKGSEEHLRGYSCSVWMLFHSVTVSASISPINKTLPSNKTGLHTLLIIRNYMQYFFTCEECTTNFLKHTVYWTHDLLNPASVWSDKRAVLEMWKIHNQVNKRLHQSPLTEDPFHPKIQFPARPDCSVCRRRVDNRDSVFVYQYSNWDLEEVYEFLVAYYSNAKSKSCLDKGKSILVSPWSQCSKSCDTGVSMRMTNQNEECVLRMETRLCIDIPCHLILPQHQECEDTGTIYRLGNPINFEINNCTSEALEDWKVCGKCSQQGDQLCCRPSATSNRKVNIICRNLELSRKADDGSVWLNRLRASVDTVATKINVQVVDMCHCSKDFC